MKAVPMSKPARSEITIQRVIIPVAAAVAVVVLVLAAMVLDNDDLPFRCCAADTPFCFI